MSFGLNCVNDSGELTMSSDGYLFGYLGKATYVSTTQPGTSTTDSLSGYSTYTFTWGAPIMCAVGLVNNEPTSIIGFSNSGSTWTITVYHGTGATTTLGFDVQATSTDVYVWGLPVSLPAFGMALYNAAGDLVGDLSRQPLTFKDRISMATSVTTASMSGYTKPAILGYPEMNEQMSSHVGAIWKNRVLAGSWMWESSLDQLDRVHAQTEYFEDDGGIPVFNNFYPTDAVLIEASGLT